MDLRKKNIMVAIIIGAVALMAYLFSIAKFLLSGSHP